MLDDSAEDEDLALVPTVTVNEALIVRHAGLRSDPSDQREVLVNILRCELHAALSLMEHRER